MASVLVVAAHPDDEVLLCGGTVYQWSRSGADLTACVLAAGAEARGSRPADNDLRRHMRAASEILGMATPICGDFPNIEMNTVPHLKLVQFIEDAIRRTKPRIIVTHHPGDVNDDHRVTAAACQAAARLPQRQPSAAPALGALLYGEVLSSTDWAFPGSHPPFTPTAFVHIGADGLQRKLEALGEYEGVMRPYPHPRSEEALRGLAAIRGAAAGVVNAEAFQLAYGDLSNLDRMWS